MKNIEINIKEFVLMVWNDKRKMCAYCLICGFIGLVFAFTTPKEYKASVLLAPESTSNNLSSNISSLASIVGIGLNFTSDDAIFPEIYPDLIQSADFTVDLLNIDVTTSKGATHSYFEHLTKYHKSALYDWPKVGLAKILELIAPKGAVNETRRDDNGTFWITRQQEKVIKNISKIIDCEIDKKTDVISITVSDQDPLVAANIADSVKTHLQNAITDYRTKKAKTDLSYFQIIFEEAKKEYKNARLKYAEFIDANGSVILQKVKIKEEELKTEVDLAEAVYTQAAEQLQLAKAKVQEKTPAFAVLQSAYVPTKHSNIPKIVTLTIFIFIGFMIRCLILLCKNHNA